MANYLRDSGLAEMLRQTEKAHIEKNKEKVKQQAADLAAGAPLRSRFTSAQTSPLLKSPPFTPTSKAQQGYALTPEKTLPVGGAVRLVGLKAIQFNGKEGRVIGHGEPSSGRVLVELDDGETKAFKVENLIMLDPAYRTAAEDCQDKVQVADELHMKTVPLTLDEIEWLTDVAERAGNTTISGVVRRVVEWANAETPEAKKKIFLQVRCRRCSAGAKGGVKKDRDLGLPATQWQWLENVKERCTHASIGKTIRIIVDFYMPLCKNDSDFEQKLFQVGQEGKSRGQQNAVENVETTSERGLGA